MPEGREQPGEEALSLGKGGEGGRVSHPEVTHSYSRERPELNKMAWSQWLPRSDGREQKLANLGQ